MYFKDYLPITISLVALGLSIWNFILNYREKRLNLSASLNSDYERDYIEIYNNSFRKISITYFELYWKPSRFSSRKKYVRTWYDDGGEAKFSIPAHESHSINFIEQYSIRSFLASSVNKPLYLVIVLNGTKKKRIRLR